MMALQKYRKYIWCVHVLWKIGMVFTSVLRSSAFVVVML